MKFLLLTIGVLAVASFQTIKADGGQCVMYGNCGLNPDRPPWSEFQLNCLDYGPPRTVPSSESYQQLSHYCPELVDEFGDKLCCDDVQIADLTMNFVLPKHLLEKCPACYYNFRQIFCALTCSPKQFEFLRPNRVVLNEQGRPMIRTLDMYVEDSYVVDTYNSCKGVTMFYDGKYWPAMDLLCGPWGADNCTAHRLYDYFVSDNGYTPFDINFKNIAENVTIPGVEPYSFPTLGCSEPIGTNSSKPCSCLDCKDSCPRP